MAYSRKDKKGRVLRKGETQRKCDGKYVYTYTDTLGRRRSIYSRLWINSKTYRGFNGKISRILWKTVETYTGLYHPGNGIRTGRDRYCRGPAVYRHRSCRSK